ncbi:MAG: hypothetical protein KDD33_10330, partial [Bdellovibrionales bacterium]|nr:hypothetical protein [Bdellovibrionales bacterium]
FLVALLFGQSLLAAPGPIRIYTEIYHQGRRISTNSALVKSGQKSVVKSEARDTRRGAQHYNVEISPRSVNRKGPIHLSYNVSIKEKNHETLNHGSFKVRPGEVTEISIDRGRTLIKLKAQEAI